MKRIILAAAAILCLASCSYRVYPVSTLADNYNLVMQTQEELIAKENVTIYLSENEVPGPYKLIAFVENRPVLPIAVADQQIKNFYKNAVLKADELGGNAIIVESIRSFKVIDVSGQKVRKPKPPRQMAPPTSKPRYTPAENEQKETAQPKAQREPREKLDPNKLIDKVKGAPIFQKRERPERDVTPQSTQETKAKAEPAPTTRSESVTTPAKAVQAAAPANSPVFDDSTLQWFTSGYVYRAKEQEQTEIIEAMNAEIRDNLKVCNSKAEADFITKKIDQLEKYNFTLPIPSGTQTNKIKAYRNALKKLVAKFE